MYTSESVSEFEDNQVDRDIEKKEVESNCLRLKKIKLNVKMLLKTRRSKSKKIMSMK
jgi:hypothetical protein